MAATSGSPPGSDPTPSVTLPLPAERARHPASLPPGAVEPTVLWIGADPALARGVGAALRRRGVHLDQASFDSAVAAAVVIAPDLVVLCAEELPDAGRALLGELQARPETSVVPVALLQEDSALDARLRAFRHGAASVLPKKASVDDLAGRIADLAREIPDRTGEALGELGEATLEELVSTLGAELRSGILSVSGAHGEDAIRLVLGRGRPLAQLIEEFVQKAREHVRSAEPLQYEFDARAGGTIRLLDGSAPSKWEAVSTLGGLRVVLADAHTSRAEAVSHELRRYGAEVIVSDLEPTETRLIQIRQADPTVLLIGDDHAQEGGYDLIRRMRQDARLRWVSLLVVRWSELWQEERTDSLERLATALGRLGEPERHLLEQTQQLACFDARLETLGPARTLRSLAPSPHGLRVTVTNPRLQVELDLANGLLVGALARVLEEPRGIFEGAEAVSALLQLSSGRVQVDRVAHPARANLMASVEMALGLADGEAPPIRPSLPVEGTSGSEPEPWVSPAIDATVAAPPLLPSIPVRPWSPGVTQALTPAALLAGSPATRLESTDLSDSPAPFDLATSSRESAAPPPRELTALDPGSPPPSLPLSPVDLRLRRLLQVDETGPSASLIAVLAFLALVQLAWMAALIASAAPQPGPPQLPSSEQDLPLAMSAPTPPAERPSPPSMQGAQPEHTLLAPDQTPPADAPAVLPLPDGSDRKAPTCDALLADTPQREGHFPGLANQEARAAQAALVSGRIREAQEHYCRALRWDDTSAALWSSLAQVFMLQGDGEQAAMAAERSVGLAPQDGPAQVILADALARLGQAERARQLWRTAAKLRVAEDKAHAALAGRDLPEARRAERAGDLSQAERMYRRVALLAPDRATGAAGLGRILAAAGQPGAARLWAQYALKVAPEDADAHVALGDALAAANDQQGAREAWQKALSLQPRHPHAMKRLR